MKAVPYGIIYTENFKSMHSTIEFKEKPTASVIFDTAVARPT